VGFVVLDFVGRFGFVVEVRKNLERCWNAQESHCSQLLVICQCLGGLLRVCMISLILVAWLAWMVIGWNLTCFGLQLMG